MCDENSPSGHPDAVLKDAVLEKLQKREKDRQTDLEKKRFDKEQKDEESEQVNSFLKTFAEQRDSVLEMLNSVSLGEKEKFGDRFDAINNGIQQLQKILSASTMFLPSYHIRHSLDVVQNIQQQMQDKEVELLPKKKFGFKAKKKALKEPNSTNESSATSVVDGHVKVMSYGSAVGIGDTGFSDRQNEVLVLNENDVNHKNVILSNMTNCTIQVFGLPSTIHMSHMKKCKIMTGPVTTSIFIEDAHNSIFALACQQLRVHSTKESDFYLHVTSRAIVEDCQELRFAPYSWSYDDLDEHFNKSGLDREKNNWQCIDDFNWLVLHEPSPNWRVVPESEILKSWDTTLL